MRRLDPDGTLEHAIAARTLTVRQLDRLLVALKDFYRHAAAVFVSPEAHLLGLRRTIAFDMRVLLDARLDRQFGLPGGLVRDIGRVQRHFLARHAALIAGRVRDRRIVDGHGDLRPEHIWLGPPVRVIDCLEFNAGLRAVDPFDEIAFLCLECERLGCGWGASHIVRRARQVLPHAPPDGLFAFYRCHRAVMRARLAAAHLLEPEPRTPEKWRRQAGAYLQLAAGDARRLDRLLVRGRVTSGARSFRGTMRSRP
jgi:aminoglycoside phosphotransferase family enzyme